MKSDPLATIISVRVQPRASCNSIAMQPDGTLKIRLTAPPAEGQANSALIDYLARCLQLPKRSIQIVTGKAGRRKIVRIEGIHPASLKGRLANNSERGF